MGSPAKYSGTPRSSLIWICSYLNQAACAGTLYSTFGGSSSGGIPFAASPACSGRAKNQRLRLLISADHVNHH